MGTARALLEVTAGIIPGKPMPEYTKQWAISTEEWSEANKSTDPAVQPSILLATKQGTAAGYAQLLMLQPDRINWVRMDWIWL